MKKHLIFVTALLIVTLLATVTPVSADPNQPIGERIRVYEGYREFPAGVPFNIMHGWVQTSEDGAIGVFDFELEVDGVLQIEGFKMFSADSGEPDTLWRLWVFNFSNEFTGIHTFTGHWYAPCQYAVESLGYPGPCATPNARVETAARTLTVNFIP